MTHLSVNIIFFRIIFCALANKFFTIPSQIKQSLVIPKNIPIQTNYLSNIDDITLNKIQQYKNNVMNVPIVINGNEYKGDEMRQLCPYDTSKKVCYYYYATDSTLDTAIKSFEKGKNIVHQKNFTNSISKPFFTFNFPLR